MWQKATYLDLGRQDFDMRKERNFTDTVRRSSASGSLLAASRLLPQLCRLLHAWHEVLGTRK